MSKEFDFRSLKKQEEVVKEDKQIENAFGTEEPAKDNNIRLEGATFKDGKSVEFVYPEEPKKPQPKISKIKTTKYPLETIKIDRSKLSLTEAKEVILDDIELYNFTIENIVNEKDFITIGNNKHLCKSGVRKLQLALNISTEIISNDVWKEDDQWIAKYIVKAIAPSGRFATSVGVCEQFEKGRKRTRHDTEATAQTRATSRAIMDLVGFGAVSAEEIQSTDGDIEDAFGNK